MHPQYGSWYDVLEYAFSSTVCMFSTRTFKVNKLLMSLHTRDPFVRCDIPQQPGDFWDFPKSYGTCYTPSSRHQTTYSLINLIDFPLIITTQWSSDKILFAPSKDHSTQHKRNRRRLDILNNHTFIASLRRKSPFFQWGDLHLFEVWHQEALAFSLFIWPVKYEIKHRVMLANCFIYYVLQTTLYMCSLLCLFRYDLLFGCLLCVLFQTGN